MTQDEIRYRGAVLSEGVAIGSLYLLKSHEDWAIPEFSITAAKIDQEIERYRSARTRSKKELETLRGVLKDEGSLEAVTIIDSHIQMLEDPFLIDGVEGKIRDLQKNTESVFKNVIDEYVGYFHNLEDHDMQERAIDVKDLSSRIMKHLHRQQASSNTIPLQSIVYSYELIPSQTAEVSPNHVKAFLTEIGGRTSHAALIARSKGLPYLSNISLDWVKEHEGASIILDGNEGLVIVYPTVETLTHYKALEQKRPYFIPKDSLPITPETQDGTAITVYANLESLYDLHLLREYKVSGIGLVRTEFLYLKKELVAFDENEQFLLYRKLLQLAGNMEVTFRLFDLGSDKKLFCSPISEPNPALGCRSLRFLMRYQDLFRSQVRALLRASQFGELKILLPLVTDVQELLEAKAFIAKEREALLEKGVKVADFIPIGCMVEVPAFVIMCDQLVKHCDFLSIGTNDLTQYTLAADRSNPDTCYRYGPLHESVQRMIKLVVEEANKKGIPVSVCGEVASNLAFTQTLLELGVRIFSASPRFIPLLKEKIQTLTLPRAFS